MDSAEETWYNHGTATIPRPSLGGRGCWQHPRGTGVSSNRFLPITGTRFNVPIRAIRRPTTIAWSRRCWRVAIRSRSATSNTTPALWPGQAPGSHELQVNWLRVLRRAKAPQIDERVGHQLHAIVPALMVL